MYPHSRTHCRVAGVSLAKAMRRRVAGSDVPGLLVADHAQPVQHDAETEAVDQLLELVLVVPSARRLQGLYPDKAAIHLNTSTAARAASSSPITPSLALQLIADAVA